MLDLENPKDLKDRKDLEDSIRFELLIFGPVARHCRYELAIFSPIAHHFCLDFKIFAAGDPYFHEPLAKFTSVAYSLIQCFFSCVKKEKPYVKILRYFCQSLRENSEPSVKIS